MLGLNGVTPDDKVGARLWRLMVAGLAVQLALQVGRLWMCCGMQEHLFSAMADSWLVGHA